MPIDDRFLTLMLFDEGRSCEFWGRHCDRVDCGSGAPLIALDRFEMAEKRHVPMRHGEAWQMACRAAKKVGMAVCRMWPCGLAPLAEGCTTAFFTLFR